MLTSCYHYKSDVSSDYGEFRIDMKSKAKGIYDFLPDLENEDVIKDVFMYYSDADLIDSFYTVYLNCQYSEEEYNKEKERLEKVLKGANVDSNSFELPSIVADEYMNGEYPYNSVYMRYSYALFDEDEFRIIYVEFFDKELNGYSTNIPEEYLPKKLVAARCF